MLEGVSSIKHTCDCVDAWRLQTPPHGMRGSGASVGGPMICEVCGLIVEGSASPRAPKMRVGSPLKNIESTVHENASLTISPSLSGSMMGAMSLGGNSTTPPETPLGMMRGETPMFFPSSPPSTEVMPTPFLSNLNETKDVSDVDGLISKFPPSRGITTTNEFDLDSVNTGSLASRSRNQQTTVGSKDKYSTPWTKMREKSADTSMSLSLGMCLPNKSKLRSRRVNGPSTTPTRKQDTPSHRQTTIAQHMARFEKERIPNDKASLVASHCSSQCQPGPPVDNSSDDGLFILGHTKTRPSRKGVRRKRGPPPNKTPVGEPFSMSGSALVSPLSELPFVEAESALSQSKSQSKGTFSSVQRVSRVNPSNDKAIGSSNYWAIEFGAEERLRAATAATCRRRVGGKLHSDVTHLDGMSQTITTAYSSTMGPALSLASTSFRTRVHETRSSGYADHQKQLARSSLLWPTADPDGTRRPSTQAFTHRNSTKR